MFIVVHIFDGGDMISPTEPQAQTGATSAFLAPAPHHDSRSDIWAEAGHAIEIAQRKADRPGFTTRTVIVLVMLVIVKVCANWVMR
jgi:hypothetical protein